MTKMIKKGDKLIIVCEALQDENSDTVLVKLNSSMQSSIVMLTENVKKAPEPMEISLHGEYGYKDTTTIKYIKEGYNQALRDCGISEEPNLIV